jgi:flagellin
MISIQTNVASLMGEVNYDTVQTQEQNTIEQLTSGYRINSSADDAAGLAIANSLQAEQTELTQGVANANDGVSQLQIIDGGLTNVSTILDRLQTLATEAGSTTFTGDFSTLNNEFQTDISELNRQASNIGLNTGGQFNENLAVYVGGGIGNQNGAQIGTAIENINLGNVSATQSAISATGSYSGSFTQLTETTAAGYTATSAGNTTVSFSGTSGYSALAATTSAALGASVSASTSTASTNFTVTQSALTATYFNSVDAYSLGLATGTAATAATNIAVTNVTSAQAAIAAVAQAVINLGTVQGAVGAGINQLNFAVGLAQSQITNYASDQSQIRDADVATDASELSREQVLSQAGIAALAQANQMPQAVLKLLQ